MDAEKSSMGNRFSVALHIVSSWGPNGALCAARPFSVAAAWLATINGLRLPKPYCFSVWVDLDLRPGWISIWAHLNLDFGWVPV